MNLNPAQTQAVHARAQDMLVLACAGAGKTRVLIERIATLVETNTPPWAIAAVTFTNKAADEMRDRLAARIGKGRAARVWMGTFHAYAAKTLRDFGALAGFPDGFSIYDDEDRLDVLRICAHEMGLKNTAKDPSIEGIEGIAARAGKGTLLRSLYTATLRRYAATDYDGLEHHLLALLQSPEVRTEVGALREILVDEYQDTNDVQETILGEMRNAAPAIRIMRVGDPSQAIYGFRGTKIENILRAAERPGMEVIRLATNYRSGIEIVEAGNRISAHTGSPLGRVQAGRDVAGAVNLEVHPDEIRRAESVAMTVKLQVAGGRAPSDIMVLGRTWKALAAVEAELRALGVPCDYPKREADAWRSVPMRWLVSAMRLHANGRDGVALRRLLSWPVAACSEAQILRAEVRSNGATLAELRRDGTGGARLVQVQADTAGEFATRFAATSDAWETLEYRGMDTARDELDAAVARIVAWTERRAAAEQDVSVKAFLAWYTFRDVRDAEAQATPSVRLMTVHAAKGLEAPVVHFIGPDRGVFPKVGEDERGEELRLWYVAVTRAMDEFHAHAAREVAQSWGAPTRAAGPSPFAAYLADPEREVVAS